MRISVEKLNEAIVALIKFMGGQDTEACLVSESLVGADLRGIHTHGCAYIPIIAERYAHGVLNIPTRTDRIRDEGAVAHIDGNNGLGQVAAAEAMQVSIDKARQFGVALTLVRNTNNIGFLGFYTGMAADQGMLGICMTNAAAALAPWGGTEPFFGTNPLSIAVPVSRQAPIVLDMSASAVARGKIRRAQKLNEKIPLGWALDEFGNPTTDPAKALKGTVLPIAGPKGYGLALFIDFICGLLSGSKYGRDLLTFHKPIGPTGVGAMFMAINISGFMPLERFETLVFEYAEAIRNSKKADVVARIFLPGEIEALKTQASLTEGVEVDAKTIMQINQLLEKADLSIHIKENE